MNPKNWTLKFIYSEKATKFCKIFALLLTVCTVVKNKGKTSQNFVAFSEYMNFNVRFLGLSWIPLPTLVSEVSNGCTLSRRKYIITKLELYNSIVHNSEEVLRTRIKGKQFCTQKKSRQIKNDCH